MNKKKYDNVEKKNNRALMTIIYGVRFIKVSMQQQECYQNEHVTQEGHKFV